MAEARIQIILSDGRKAGETLKELGKDANRLNKELKDLKPGTEQFVAKSKDLQQVNARLKEVKDQINGTTQASNALKNVFDQYVPFSGQFAEIGRQIGGVKSGVGGLTSGFGLLKGAIAATGIGLLIVLLGSLWSWFSKTERGADFLSKAMAAAGAAVNVLIDRASKLIDALIAFVQGDWSEAADKFGEATRDVTEEMIRETKAAWELADALDQLEELEGKLILLRSRTKQQVSELRLLSKDESKSFAERSAALETAIELTRQLNQQELEAKQGRVLQALQVKDLAALQKQYGVTLDELRAKGENLLTVDNLGMGESTQEDLNAAFQAIADYNEAIAASNDAERTLVMDLNTLKKKSRREDSKDQKEELAAQKKALEEHYKAEDNIRKLEGEKRLALIEDEKTREIEALNIATEEKILALQGSEAQILEQIKLLRDIQGAELAAIDKKWAEKKAEEDKKAKEEQKARDEKLAEEQKRLAEEKAQFEFEMDEMTRDMAQDSFAFATELSARRIKDEEAAKKVRKAGALIDIGINLQRELSANSLHAATLGPIAGPIYLAGANFRSYLRAGISAARVIAFRRGGVLKGKSHEQGGMPFTIDGQGGFEAEGEEILMTKGVYRNPMLRRAASAINVLGGGRQFAAGGPLTFTDRAPVSRSASTSTGPVGNALGLDALSSKLDQLIEAQDRRIDRLKVINVATETEDVLRVVNQIRNEADI